jgi:hypothetical protein
LVFGPGTGAAQSVVRVLVEPYSDGQPTTDPQTAGGRTVFAYVVLATVGKPAEARAWWREPTGTCPLVTVALVSPGQDPSAQQSDLLRIVASIPSFAASPAPTSRSSAGYGVLIRRPDGRIDLLPEGGSAPTTLDTRADALAVSPDGRDIAYWGGPDARELWIAPARAFQGGRILLTLTDERGTGIVWSPDGESLMFAAASTTFGPGPLAAPTYTALRVITFVGPPDPRELARIDTGQVVRPLAWDGSRGIGAAQEGAGQKGPGRYIVVANHTIVTGGTKDSNIRFVDLPDALEPSVAIGRLQASSDARFVMARWHYSDRDLVRFWPIEGLDMGLLRELAPERAGDSISDAAWRPRSLEIGVNTAGQFQLWTLDGQRRQVRGLTEGVTLSFRYDGSALYSTTIGNGQLELTELIAPFGTRQLPPAPGPALASVELGGVR